MPREGCAEASVPVAAKQQQTRTCLRITDPDDTPRRQVLCSFYGAATYQLICGVISQ